MFKCFAVLLWIAGAALGQSNLSNLSAVWAKTFNVFPTSLVVDSEGNSFVLGNGEPGFAPTNPLYGSGRPDIVVMKVDPSGNLIWSTALSGGQVAGLAIDSAKNVYIAGTADGSIFPTTPGAFQTRLNKVVAYAAKLNGSGVLEWATLLGAQDTASQGNAVAVDANGVYVAGHAFGPSFPTTPGAFQKNGTVDSHGFITKLNLTGSALLYSTLLGGTGGDDINKIAIDSQGAVFALGTSSSSDFPLTPGAYRFAGCMFLAKMNPSGSGLLFSTFVASPDPETHFCVPHGFSIDSSGNSYVGVSPHVLKVNSTGTALIYDRSLAGNRDAKVFDLVTDSLGNAYVVGSTAASDLPIPAPCFRLVAGAPVAATDFIVRLDPLGGIADGGYLPLPVDSNRGGLLVKTDSGVANFYTADLVGGLNGMTLRKFSSGGNTPAPVRLRCVGNAGHFGKAPVAPGEIVALFGDGIGPDQAANLQLDGSGKVVNTLANTQVLFDGIPAPLVYVQSRQINAIVPWQLQGRTTTEVCVVYAGAKTNCITLPVSEMSPGFFRIRPGYLAALNEDSSINSPENPAKQGSIVTVFLTGSGPSVPPEADGEVTQGVRPSALGVNMFITVFLDPFHTRQIPIEVLLHSPAPALVSGVEVIQFRAPYPLTYGVSLTMTSSTGALLGDGDTIYMAP